MEVNEKMSQEVNEEKLHAFLGKMVTEMGAAAVGPLILIGDRLGLYKALAEYGPTGSRQLADATGTSERYIREWLAAQAASGYIEYHPEKVTEIMAVVEKAREELGDLNVGLERGSENREIGKLK